VILHLTSTSKVVELDGVPARVWEGATESGIAVHAFVVRSWSSMTRRATPTSQDEPGRVGVLSAFDDELVRQDAATRATTAALAADVVELRARRLCLAAEPHGSGRVPCPDHVRESRRQLGGER